MNKKDFHRTMVIDGNAMKYRVLGTAQIDGYRLAFNAYSCIRQGGVLDIEKYGEKCVIGILYELSEEAIKKLDIREGSKYKRIQVEVRVGNQKIKAYTYIIKEKIKTRANVKYSGIVYHAMLENSFPQQYIDEFVKMVRISIYGSEENYFEYKANQKKELSYG